tara:strand:+ start:45 stop:440 length:396 start_codon:yes stop_codon:yes gene_type:complete
VALLVKAKLAAAVETTVCLASPVVEAVVRALPVVMPASALKAKVQLLAAKAEQQQLLSCPERLLICALVAAVVSTVDHLRHQFNSQAPVVILAAVTAIVQTMIETKRHTPPDLAAVEEARQHRQVEVKVAL